MRSEFAQPGSTDDEALERSEKLHELNTEAVGVVRPVRNRRSFQGGLHRLLNLHFSLRAPCLLREPEGHHDRMVQIFDESLTSASVNEIDDEPEQQSHMGGWIVARVAAAQAVVEADYW
eukprot:CAMPEP_0119434234 /NCGR_PEP_ID=MMETSP1335-20130426/50568_1 /TAXON_ID=259385 /ORGANISM="Chrysoculter rhomboideus, Strain RCC1486" /LENGTH=118 /DNA_ID=CAMNT_0007460089 /DNA_START=340 /DNA_END=694 /DNA_ORIENTATION=-